MSSLYSTIFTNDDIKNNVSLRHENFNLNYDLISKMLSSCNSNIFKPGYTWHVKKFKRNEITNAESIPGIYMFVLKPYSDMAGLSSDYILYIGQTKDLKARFDSYFNYKNAQKPSDQLKRKMNLIWEDHLYFQFIKLPTATKSMLDDIEYDLIDAIIPPFNAQYRSDNVKSYMKIINPN